MKDPAWIITLRKEEPETSMSIFRIRNLRQPECGSEVSGGWGGQKARVASRHGALAWGHEMF